ncbi:MAG: LytTR family DNA-binding domain-containing protein [Bacteroidales bacterium]|jgi:two-component system LytT family response regulator|nr:LytTR family DNA-binding domain-containing protein [Bacteroidales bacterium]
MIRTVIIDDERPAREVIANYLAEYCPDIEVVGQASSVREGFTAIKASTPDLVFLDVEMADGTGFDLLSMFGKVDFRVIFVTAYSEYAIRAFRFSAADYLLKPVSIDELIHAVEKVRTRENTALNNEVISSLLKNLREGPARQSTLIIPNIKGFEVLKVPEIIMCQADGYCTNFHLTGQRKVVSSKNLKHFDGLLADQGFLRVHHSYLVNIDHVTGYTKQGEILLSENLKASLGSSYKNEFIRNFSGK